MTIPIRDHTEVTTVTVEAFGAGHVSDNILQGVDSAHYLNCAYNLS